MGVFAVLFVYPIICSMLRIPIALDLISLAQSFKDECTKHALCGPDTSYDISTSLVCTCLDGFVPKSQTNWNLSNWSDGCVRRSSLLDCNGTDGFRKYSGVKLPSTSSSWYDAVGLKERESLCLKNCSYLWRINRRKPGENDNNNSKEEEWELPIFDLTIIADATNNFSSSNKLGQGGFGPVHEGTLLGGQEIAEKRLSKSSDQGLNEFRNEVLLISKLQHGNLVKLLGCCIHQEEKMLSYEYMPNKCVDYYIFDLTT